MLKLFVCLIKGIDVYFAKLGDRIERLPKVLIALILIVGVGLTLMFAWATREVENPYLKSAIIAIAIIGFAHSIGLTLPNLLPHDADDSPEPTSDE